MKKNHWGIVQNDHPNLKSAKAYESTFVFPQDLLNALENDSLTLIYFLLSEKTCEFHFLYQHEDPAIQETMIFTLEMFHDYLLFDVNGHQLTDNARFVASIMMNDIKNMLRFIHKTKKWSFGHAFLQDQSAYLQRLQSTFINPVLDQLTKIHVPFPEEDWDPEDYLLSKIKSLKDIQLCMIGDDAKFLGSFLQAFPGLVFTQTAFNQYEISIQNLPSKEEEMKYKIVLARVLAKFHYNVFITFIS